MKSTVQSPNVGNGAVQGGFRRVTASVHAQRTLQPLDELSCHMKPSSSVKSHVRLSIGDPTADGNLRSPACVTEALVDVIRSGEFNGYPPTVGYDSTRKVVAEYGRRFCSTDSRRQYLTWDNVILTSGVSHGILIAVTALCNPGDNILVCGPAFPHYKTVCDSYGIECRYYALDPQRRWECDLVDAARQVDARTKAFVMINPSNPCGSNYAREHVQEIIHFCEHHELPIMSDEIYAEIVYSGEVFTSVADFDTRVPRLVLGGVSKYQVCPGWRIGWTILIDPLHVAHAWQEGMEHIAQLVSGPNSICQQAVTRSLLQVPPSHTQDLVRQLEKGAEVYERLLEHDIGISFDKPRASMFVMLKINYGYFKDINSDMDFYEKLLDEENVQVLPGEIFGAKGGFVRATTSRPTKIVNEAVDRIIEFCQRHKK